MRLNLKFFFFFFFTYLLNILRGGKARAKANKSSLCQVKKMQLLFLRSHAVSGGGRRFGDLPGTGEIKCII